MQFDLRVEAVRDALPALPRALVFQLSIVVCMACLVWYWCGQDRVVLAGVVLTPLVVWRGSPKCCTQQYRR